MILLLATHVAVVASPAPQTKMVIQNRFGGPTYQREPAADVTASLFKAGGGAGSFSMVRAFSSMIGAPEFQSELTALRSKFSSDDVDNFVSIFDFAMSDAWKRLGENNVKIPANGSLEGRDLAQAIVMAGTTDSGNFYSGYLFDKLLTMRVNNVVNGDIDMKFGVIPNTSYHTIAATFFYDIAQLLGDRNVTLPKR